MFVLAALVVIDASAQAPTFSTKVVSVPIDVLVVDSTGLPIAQLAPTDFEVLDNGVTQPVGLIDIEHLPLNVILALDTSGSVVGDRLLRLRDSASAVLAKLKVGDEAALVSFSHAVRREMPLTNDLASVRHAIETLTPWGETALVDATYTALLTAESKTGRSLVLVFSDGVDTRSWLTPESVLRAARRSNAVVCAATLTTAAHGSFLRELTRITGGGAEVLKSDRDVQSAFLRIIDEFRARYLLTYTPRADAQPGWHKLEVRVKKRHARVRAREGYFGGS